MAKDPGASTGGAFSSDTLDQLHRSLLAFVHDDREDSLRAALRRLSLEAQRGGIPPEGVLIQLKQQWYALPSNTERAASSADLRTLERVVTMCIKEYFR